MFKDTLNKIHIVFLYNQEIDRTWRSQQDSNLRGKTPGNPKTIEIISWRNSISGKISTETIGKDGKTPKTSEERFHMELGKATR